MPRQTKKLANKTITKNKSESPRLIVIAVVGGLVLLAGIGIAVSVVMLASNANKHDKEAYNQELRKFYDTRQVLNDVRAELVTSLAFSQVEPLEGYCSSRGSGLNTNWICETFFSFKTSDVTNETYDSLENGISRALKGSRNIRNFDSKQQEKRDTGKKVNGAVFQIAQYPDISCSVYSTLSINGDYSMMTRCEWKANEIIYPDADKDKFL